MGRRYNFEDPRTSTVIVRVTKKEHELFKKLAKKSGKSMSELVREVLMREYMKSIKDDF